MLRALTEERASTESIQRLWERYRASGDPRLRDRLVLSLAPMVKYLVYRKAREIPARCEVEDFISCGLEALMHSIERYDPARGATLEQFVWTRIQGAVLDELRRNDWAPRSLRRTEREMVTAREAFLAAEGRQPSRTELAERLGISVTALDRRISDVQRSQVGSLNVLVVGEDDASVERIETLRSTDAAADPERATLREQAKARFREAFDQLPQRERQVAVLLYVDNLTLREIGGTLGVSESRVCQIHTRLRQRLRQALADDEQLICDVA